MSNNSGPVQWGVLGAADIALKKVIPAMQRTPSSPVLAIASRDLAKAKAAAAAHGIPRAYGSYDELLADPDIEAIYNPLPNHLHVPWTLRAAEAGKHVLCEKPLALTAAEARELLAVRERTGALIGEAFMVRTHPQWLKARDLVRAGRIGALSLITGQFTYPKRPPGDIRNLVEFGGGGLLDIGCYPITMSRWIYDAEPTSVVAMIERDAENAVDWLASALMRFPNGQATFSCATQLAPYQRMQLHGTLGRIELEIPFNAPPDRPCRILLDTGDNIETITVPIADQYGVQADDFSRAVRGEGDVSVPLEDAIANMMVIDAIFRSAQSGNWETPR